jgi:hypothetical protein
MAVDASFENVIVANEPTSISFRVIFENGVARASGQVDGTGHGGNGGTNGGEIGQELAHGLIRI